MLTLECSKCATVVGELAKDSRLLRGTEFYCPRCVVELKSKLRKSGPTPMPDFFKDLFGGLNGRV